MFAKHPPSTGRRPRLSHTTWPEVQLRGPMLSRLLTPSSPPHSAVVTPSVTSQMQDCTPRARTDLLGKCWETKEGVRRKREIKETGEVRRGGDGNRKRCRTRCGRELQERNGLASPSRTRSHADCLHKTVVGGGSVILGPRFSFTFNTGAPRGWASSLGLAGRGAAGQGRDAADRCPLLPAAYLVQAVRAAGKCDAVFKGFSDCLLKLGDSMANYPQGLDDKTNIKTVCT